jgi:hypothetical protein
MTKASDTGLRQNRVVMMMSDAELKALDDWRFDQKIASRGEAVRRLIAVSTTSKASGLKGLPWIFQKPNTGLNNLNLSGQVVGEAYRIENKPQS